MSISLLGSARAHSMGDLSYRYRMDELQRSRDRFDGRIVLSLSTDLTSVAIQGVAVRYLHPAGLPAMTHR